MPLSRTLSSYFDPDAWIAAYERTQAELDGAALLSGGWIEFGMGGRAVGGLDRRSAGTAKARRICYHSRPGWLGRPGATCQIRNPMD